MIASRQKLRSPVVLLALGVTLSLGLFTAPRPTQSRVIPLPRIDFHELQVRDRVELELGQGAPLSLPVRRAGERFRRLGAALAGQSGTVPVKLAYRIDDARKAAFDLEREIEALRAGGLSQELIRLRAIQSELFVQAVRRFERERTPDSELIELGGDFAVVASSAWFEGERLVFADRDLRLLFRVRFGRLTGTHEQGQFGPTKNELLYFQSLLMLHPPGDALAASNYRLGVVSALERLDPAYPAPLARGLFLLRQAQPEAAGRALAEVKGRSGPWARITENTLLAASALHADP